MWSNSYIRVGEFPNTTSLRQARDSGHGRDVAASARDLRRRCVGGRWCGTSAAGIPRNDYLLVFPQRAGPYRFADSFLSGRQKAYPAAVAAFGKPTASSTELIRWSNEDGTEDQRAGLCHVTWVDPGLTLTLVSISDEVEPHMPRFLPCSAPALTRRRLCLGSALGTKWHNRRGTRIGAPPTALSGTALGCGNRANAPTSGFPLGAERARALPVRRGRSQWPGHRDRRETSRVSLGLSFPPLF